MKPYVYKKAWYVYADIEFKVKEMVSNHNYNSKLLLSSSDLLYDFDLIIQAMLFNCLLLDGKTSESELKFINSLHSNANILDFIKKYMPNSFDLNKLSFDYIINYKIELNDYQKFIDQFTRIIYDNTRELISALAMMDSITEFNYFDFFNSKLKELMSLFCSEDGSISEEENKDMYRGLEILFNNQYLELKTVYEKVNKLNFITGIKNE